MHRTLVKKMTYVKRKMKRSQKKLGIEDLFTDSAIRRTGFVAVIGASADHAAILMHCSRMIWAAKINLIRHERWNPKTWK